MMQAVYSRKLYDTFRPVLDATLKIKWNTNWKRSLIFYNVKGVGTIDIRDMFSLDGEEENKELQGIANTFIDKYYDDRVFKILSWVKNWITYKGDFEIWKRAEYWQTPYETYKKRTGDCEDGALLIYKLTVLSGIPEWRIKVCAGDVLEPNGKGTVGHAYVIYLSELFNEWFVLDWCYYYSKSSARYLKIPQRECPEYKVIWWTFNHIYSWAQNDTLIK